ncbi:acylneuraminate cytidylyltransferase family protein [Dactylococcopsis salina]|uniref:CMP-N-acetylneuraminic acid synthetase n=1 Tax=Dactylococcopsis salina (strain PCC 8305) TaxID=13035 RepID=K9YWC9_DACS8|nr:acylneuraminate cytidylyltransferase family protein [Dactylococcopsis salina]AFZ50817.1 CMP-N-acetylneuraminic acid synthetase [Dactylococcopsis salina PCC 8305]
MSDINLGKVLALIPAKGASQRLIQKNLRSLGGRSLLSWTVRVALASQCFDRVVVSTEDQKIAEVSSNLGADVPFLRPEKLAVDPAGVVDVCLHALEQLEAQSDQFDTLVILLPSSPFRAVADIKGAINRYLESKADFLMSVTQLEHSPLSSLILDETGFLKPLHPEWIGHLGAKAKKEQIPNLVRCNGAITIVNVERFKQEKQYYAYPLAAYEMPWLRGLDIDTEQDIWFGEFLLEQSLIEEEKLLQ